MQPEDRVEREQGLRRAVLAGEEYAWRMLYDEAFTGLYAYVLWRCAGLRDRADEVVQETWLTAVRRLRSFEPSAGSFASWLRGIAANLLRNHFRRERVRRMQPLNGEPLADTSEPPADAERVAVALSALPDHYEAVLRAKYLEGQSVAAIAAAHDESPKAVESLLTRATAGVPRSVSRIGVTSCTTSFLVNPIRSTECSLRRPRRRTPGHCGRRCTRGRAACCAAVVICVSSPTPRRCSCRSPPACWRRGWLRLGQRPRRLASGVA